MMAFIEDEEEEFFGGIWKNILIDGKEKKKTIWMQCSKTKWSKVG